MIAISIKLNQIIIDGYCVPQSPLYMPLLVL